MNCELRYEGSEREYEYFRTAGALKSNRRERWFAGFFTFLLVSFFAWGVISLWGEDWQGAVSENPKGGWEHMSGNDGKFWKGTPDGSEYAQMDEVRLVRYCQYRYRSGGQLSRVNTFRHHDYYEDIWVLSDEEIYEYDFQGRISHRQAVQGNQQWIYEYTDSGYTIDCFGYSNESKPDIYAYDLNDNLIYYRNATNFRYAHATTFEYDGQNRLVRKILEVEGNDPYVTLTMEYDEENHTAVGMEYDSRGEKTYIWYHTFDENWEKTDSVWYAVEEIPPNRTPEECRDYFTKGYWAYFADGVMMAEMSNEPWDKSRNNSEYTAYDYDIHGNCVMELNVYGVGSVYMTRYVYDVQDRLIEEFEYDFSDVAFWERQQADGNLLTLQAGGDEAMSITRTAPGGEVIQQFVYGEQEVETQYASGETVYWQLSPAQMPDREEPENGTADRDSSME